MQETHPDPEARLRALASRLLFTLTKEGSRFCPDRETDAPHPVATDDLTSYEVEETLTTWKLRGPHGFALQFVLDVQTQGALAQFPARTPSAPDRASASRGAS